MHFAAIATALALLAAAPARIEDPEANIVEELVVQAREPGPAWWRVSDADTTVYILGVGDDALPSDIRWDRRYLDKRLDGANSLIVGTRVGLSAGISDIPALLRARAKLRSKTPMEETLPAPLRVRFVAAREKLGKPAGRYAGWTPLIASQLLVSDAREGRETVGIPRQIIAAAKARKVRLVDPAQYRAKPFMAEMLDTLTPAVQEQCMDGALSDLEAPPAKTRAAAEGWARGDVAAALREPRAFEKCLLILGGGGELWRRVTEDRATAVAKALETPGHSVAVMSLRNLLADDGVIETLEARGFHVAGPGEPEG